MSCILLSCIHFHQTCIPKIFAKGKKHLKSWFTTCTSTMEDPMIKVSPSTMVHTFTKMDNDTDKKSIPSPSQEPFSFSPLLWTCHNYLSTQTEVIFWCCQLSKVKSPNITKFFSNLGELVQTLQQPHITTIRMTGSTLLHKLFLLSKPSCLNIAILGKIIMIFPLHCHHLCLLSLNLKNEVCFPKKATQCNNNKIPF